MSHARESEAIPRLLAAPRLPPGAGDSLQAAGIASAWLDDHLRALALVFADPVLSRRRRTAALDWPAVRDAYRLKPMADDAAAAADRVWAESYAAFQRLAAARIRARRLGLRGSRRARLAEVERRALHRRVTRPAEPLPRAVERCARAADQSLWMQERTRLEEHWAEAWEGVSAAVAAVWVEEFAPRLAALRSLRPGLPAWALALLLTIAAILGLLVVLPG